MPFWATEEAQLEPGKTGQCIDVIPTLVMEYIKLILDEASVDRMSRGMWTKKPSNKETRVCTSVNKERHPPFQD